MTELLAPAGDLNCFYAAVNHGADAVYLGLKNFSARSGAGNFSIDELKQATDFAALFGVKVYVTVNTVIKEEELFEVLKAVLSAYLAGADGFIVQDFYFGKMLKEVFPFFGIWLRYRKAAILSIILRGNSRRFSPLLRKTYCIRPPAWKDAVLKTEKLLSASCRNRNPAR